MPHINRIRVNNVKYNFGTQFYDDFILRFDGKNALYDLANGGGKSVLMLLLFQNLIPNCTLDDKQPIEKLFRTDQGSKTIHSLVEWRLDERFVRDNYRYMLTGFCARKAREELRETAAVEYYNYVIFYRGYNDNDLVNLPLASGEGRVTYTGLKAYLRELRRQDMSLDVHIFERKGEYQRFISRYGLYESHWEILRGINKTEGHVRTYFENRYKTTRKVVEDLLIEEIIQRAFSQNSGQTGDMADTLVQIKDKLSELASRKEEIGYYDRQAEILESLAGRAELLKKVYDEKEALDTDLVKSYNTAAAMHRLKEKTLAVCQKESEYAAKHILEASRKLDTAKIQENQAHLHRLEEDTENYEKQLQRMRENYVRESQKLWLAESGNDYLRYLEIYSQWSALKAYLGQDGSEKGKLLRELQTLARIKQKLNQSEKERLRIKLHETEETFEETVLLKDRAHEKEREFFSRGAVLKSRIEAAEAAEKEKTAEVHSICMQVPVLVLENVGKTLDEKKDLRAKNALEITKLEEDRRVCGEKAERLSLEIDKNVRLQKELESEVGKLGSFLEAYANEKKKRDKLLEIYRVSDGENLADFIRRQLGRTILDIELKRKDIKNLEERLKKLKQGSPTPKSTAAEEVMEYIRRCHGLKCVFGSDYLKDVEEDERKVLISAMPYLPVAVIVESGMSHLRSDKVLLEKNLDGALVPVIGLNELFGQEKGSHEGVLFLSQNQELYVDGDLQQRYCRQMEKTLTEALAGLKRLKDREETISSDWNYLSRFEQEYQQFFSERSARWKEAGLALEEVKARRLKAGEEIEILGARKREAGEKLESLRDEAEKLDAELDLLGRLKELASELGHLNSEIYQLKGELSKNEARQRMAGEKLCDAEEQLDRLEIQKGSLRERLKAIEIQWQDIYSPYYSEGEAEEGAVSSDNVDSRFMGLKEAFEKGRSDLEDKKRLLESYEQMMATSLQLIEKRGIQKEQLEKAREEHRLAFTPTEELNRMTSELSRINGEIQRQEESLLQYRENKNKLCGSVSQGISTIEEKYGGYRQISLENEDYETFRQQQQRTLEALREKQTAAQEGIQKAYRDLRAYDDIKRDLERMIRNENLMMNRTRESYGMDMDIRHKYKDLTDKYQRIHTELRRKQESFEGDKDKTVESLRLLSAAELAETIRTEAKLPENGEAAALFIRHLQETAGLIRIEKDRIEKTIQDMVQIKDNFEKQCLQRCASIRAELERFPAYSKIMLDGRQIPMVMLKIPYIKEELQGQKMSEYIDAIVARADAYKTQEERVAYIRQQITWKRLFSVIVTDMNSIRLNLYKRERVKEQSRYLRYEEAVGSTGQSQGIYIQFLIGVINYISMVYSGGGDGAGLQKVIFIDNPFGAAKDVYIWQPIFELLRTNRVQLIVPTRGATPAITGKFDVNYVLGQKMVDKMQQTVVVDYSSNIDTTDVVYEKLEFEQEVFDFI